MQRASSLVYVMTLIENAALNLHLILKQVKYKCLLYKDLISVCMHSSIKVHAHKYILNI